MKQLHQDLTLNSVPMPGVDSDHFPTVYLDNLRDVELPDEGKITFRFKVSQETERKKEGTTSYTLDLTELVSCEGDKKNKKSSYDESEAALDKLKDSDY